MDSFNKASKKQMSIISLLLLSVLLLSLTTEASAFKLNLFSPFHHNHHNRLHNNIRCKHNNHNYHRFNQPANIINWLERTLHDTVHEIEQQAVEETQQQQLTANPTPVYTPHHNIYATKNTFVVEVDMPGVKTPKVDLSSPTTLAVSGEISDFETEFVAEQQKQQELNKQQIEDEKELNQQQSESKRLTIEEEEEEEEIVPKQEEGLVSVDKEKENDKEEEQEQLHILTRTRPTGRFELNLDLPEQHLIDTANIVALHKNGVLRIRIPKIKEKPQAKSIPVFNV